MEKLKFSREELYALVWDKPISRLSKELGIKSAELRKYCLQSDVHCLNKGIGREYNSANQL